MTIDIRWPSIPSDFYVIRASRVLRMPDTDRARQFPKKSSALVFTKPASWFSVEKPTTSVDCLLLRPIPPSNFSMTSQKKSAKRGLMGANQ
jgi:hypothetical protein